MLDAFCHLFNMWLDDNAYQLESFKNVQITKAAKITMLANRKRDGKPIGQSKCKMKYNECQQFQHFIG